jgi:hypothetical protein
MFYGHLKAGKARIFSVSADLPERPQQTPGGGPCSAGIVAAKDSGTYRCREEK